MNALIKNQKCPINNKISFQTRFRLMHMCVAHACIIVKLGAALKHRKRKLIDFAKTCSERYLEQIGNTVSKMKKSTKEQIKKDRTSD